MHDLPGSFIFFGLFAAFFFLLFSISFFAHSATLSFLVFGRIGNFPDDFLRVADGEAGSGDGAADHADTDVDDEYSDDGDGDGKDAKSGGSDVLCGFHDTFSFRVTKWHIVVVFLYVLTYTFSLGHAGRLVEKGVCIGKKRWKWYLRVDAGMASVVIAFL